MFVGGKEESGGSKQDVAKKGSCGAVFEEFGSWMFKTELGVIDVDRQDQVCMHNLVWSFMCESVDLRQE